MWPDGKKNSQNVCAETREECEEKLKVLILEMKAEIATLRRGLHMDRSTVQRYFDEIREGCACFRRSPPNF